MTPPCEWPAFTPPGLVWHCRPGMPSCDFPWHKVNDLQSMRGVRVSQGREEGPLRQENHLHKRRKREERGVQVDPLTSEATGAHSPTLRKSQRNNANTGLFKNESSPQTRHCFHSYYLSRADNELGWFSSIFHFKMSGSNLSVLLRVLNDFLGCCQVCSSANSGIFHWLNS